MTRPSSFFSWMRSWIIITRRNNEPDGYPLMFAILATFIACLGLFGLTLHNTHRKTREIGIRKAMGASIRR